MKMEFNKNYFYPNLYAASKEEVLKIMSERLLKDNLVNESYYDKVLERERRFPTGIQAIIGFAMPHTDPEYVIKDGMSIAILKEPVLFNDMVDKQNTISVRLIFLLALTKSNKHLEILQKVVELVSHKEAIEKLLNSDEENQYKFIKQYFENN